VAHTRLTSTARTRQGSETPSPPSLPPLVELADGLSDRRPHDRPRAGPGKRPKRSVSGFGPTAGKCPTADASAVTSSARTRIRPPHRRRRPRRKPLPQRRARSRRPPRDPTRSSFKPHPRDDHVARARVRVLASRHIASAIRPSSLIARSALRPATRAYKRRMVSTSSWRNGPAHPSPRRLHQSEGLRTLPRILRQRFHA
jgi:hypothetical protein